MKGGREVPEGDDLWLMYDKSPTQYHGAMHEVTQSCPTLL